MSKFLCVWDCNGIESVIDISEFENEENQRLLEMIATSKPVASRFGQLLGRLMLRARFNSHRNYEIYAIEAIEGITEENIFEMFTNNPQQSADLLRKNGVEIYSDRQNTKTVIT